MQILVTYHQHDCSSLWTALVSLQLIFDSRERKGRWDVSNTEGKTSPLSESQLNDAILWNIICLRHGVRWVKTQLWVRKSLLNSNAATSSCNLTLHLLFYLFIEDNGFFLTQLLREGWKVIAKPVDGSGAILLCCSLLLWHLALLSQVAFGA